MKKKQVLAKIDELQKNSSLLSVAELDDLGNDFTFAVFRETVTYAILFFLLFGLTLLFVGDASKLNVISPTSYFILMFLMFLLSVLCFGYFFTLYIYKNRKNDSYTFDNIKHSYLVYRIFDILSFIGSVLGVLFFLIFFVISPAEVTGVSMESTYHEGDRIFVWNLFYEPKKGDVVVIDTKTHSYPISETTEFIIKRVVATPGDTVSYDSDTRNFYVNDTLVEENVTPSQYRMLLSYQGGDEPVSYYEENKVIVPKGYYICFGDNRKNSWDSRSLGLISKEDILGKSVLRFYPFASFGFPSENHQS